MGPVLLLKALKDAGYRPKFYDIDALRPSLDQIADFFRREQPDILGVSAVVSTSYRYVKELTHVVKEASPKTKIILGGNLAASAEVLLRKCPTDICVIGEGEKILLNLVRHLEKFHDFDSSREELQKIKGITFIDSKNNFIFTGYENQFLPEEMPQINYDLLSGYSDINRYIVDPFIFNFFRNDSRSYRADRKGQKCCEVMAAMGCISRCTFCHRWFKGYRAYPMDKVINTIKNLKEKYNVGFFIIGDESFGANPKILDNFIEAIRPMEILFRVSGIKISTVYHNPGIVRELKEAGCVQMIFGMESGSDKMLTIMEKGVTRKQNMEIARLLVKESMTTVHQLVIGMPGENENTIRETIECVKAATEDMDDYPYKRLSISYFLALPGTPGYEFMRSRGLIGNGLADEERYLLEVSDMESGSRKHYKNVTEDCLSRVLYLWPYRIKTEATIHWYERRGWKPLDKPAGVVSKGGEGDSEKKVARTIWHSIRTKRFYFRIASLLGEPFWAVMLFMIRIQMYGVRRSLLFTLGIKREDDRSMFIIKEPKSLRKIVTYPNPKEVSVSEANMIPLRMGR